jgi:hypothetical protein
MKKLRLEMEEIRVETFPVADEEPARGTVHALQPTVDDTCSCECSGEGICDSEVQQCTGYQYSCVFTFCWGTECVIYC